MASTHKCPLCGIERELVPHPEKAARLVAYCSCKGSKARIVDMPESLPTGKTTRKSTTSKEITDG